MGLMKPVFTDAALKHFTKILFSFRIWIGALTNAVLSDEILIVGILLVLRLLVRTKFALYSAEFRVTTVTPEVPLSPKFEYLTDKPTLNNVGSHILPNKKEIQYEDRKGNAALPRGRHGKSRSKPCNNQHCPQACRSDK